MKRCFQVAIVSVLALLSSAIVRGQDNPLAELDWQIGPTEAQISDKATLQVPEGYVFLGAQDTSRLMEMMENIPNDNEYTFAPDDLSWYSVFTFSPVGYVEDNETLDEDALLDTVTRGTEQGNEIRRERGWSTLTILGWKFPPRYDKQSNLLEWAFLARDDASGSEVVNYNTRLLGRTGVMEVVVVASSDALDSSVSAFKQAIAGYDFVPGQRYADYREGDRMAEFGLAALIAGGAAAVATKKGFWAALVGFLIAAKKAIIAAVIGLAAWFGRAFTRKK